MRIALISVDRLECPQASSPHVPALQPLIACALSAPIFNWYVPTVELPPLPESEPEADTAVPSILPPAVVISPIADTVLAFILYELEFTTS